MITIQKHFPAFSQKACVSSQFGKEFENINSNILKNDSGLWTVFFWWPEDFTYICTTELLSFNERYNDFLIRFTRVIGASTNDMFSHLHWRKKLQQHQTEILFPMIADYNKDLSSQLGILNDDELAYRATYIIDPEGKIRWISVNDLLVGRSIDEVIRVLDALQTNELCPCGWVEGEPTMSPQIRHRLN